VKRLLVALLLAALAAAPLLAQFVPDGKWWKRPRIAAAIDLTLDQEKQLDQIFARTRPKLIDLKAELDKREFEFQQAMEDGGTADRKVVTARIEAREEARAKLQSELALMVLDMKHVLRPEQWDRLTRMQQAVRERMKERRRQMREEQRRLEDERAPDDLRRPKPATPQTPVRPKPQ
jgi:Spy/CpxP family protein refolding chaperone